MLRKFTLGVLVLAISNSSFALELYKAKIISHQESTAGGITATFKSKSNHAQFRSLEPDNEFNPIRIYTNATQQFVKLGEISNIQSEHDISIVNGTKTTQEYLISISTCIENGNADKMTDHCAYSNDTISIEPNGYFDDSKIPELLVKLNDAKPQTLASSVEVIRRTPSGELEYIGSSHASSDITPTAN